jgi:hypothetical protein
MSWIKPVTLHLLNCITQTTQVTEGRKYVHRGRHVGQPWARLTL